MTPASLGHLLLAMMVGLGIGYILGLGQGWSEYVLGRSVQGRHWFGAILFVLTILGLMLSS